jgi:hypothetical protein
MNDDAVLRADNDITDYSKIDKGFDSLVKANLNYLVFEKDEMQLYVNGKNADIYILNKLTGDIWQSSPADRGNDKIAAGINLDKLYSQLIFEYYPSTSDTASTLNSYSDCIKVGQFSFVKIDDGIRVNYGIGKKKKEYIVPTIISEKRFQELLDRFNDEEKDIFKTYYGLVSLKAIESDSDRALFGEAYPILHKRDVYIFSSGSSILNPGNPASGFLMSKMENLLKKVGYTQEDFDFDNKDNEIQANKAKDIYFDISIEYTLKDNGLVVRIPQKSIKYDENILRLTQVTVLPYFGAAGQKNKGYLFVPDGSGALINLNNGKLNFPGYEKIVYGNDNTLVAKNLDDSQIFLPVFGIKKDDSAFIGIIEKADASALIKAEISGRYNSYNSVNATFILKNRQKNNSAILNQAGMYEYQKKSLQSDIQIRYDFIQGKEANYTGMALKYQKYLLVNKKITRQNHTEKLPFYLETIGGITFKTSFAGFPYTTQKSLTGYLQSIEILKTLKMKGIENISYQYTGWCNKGVDNTVSNKADLISNLGSRDDFAKLVEYTKENEINFYPDMNFSYTANNLIYNFIESKFQGARDIPGNLSYSRKYILSLPDYSGDNYSTIILSTNFYDNMIKKFISKYKNYNINGLSVKSFGMDLNADYNEDNYSDRQMSKNEIVRQLNLLSKNDIKLSVAGANSYTLEYSDIVNNMPAASGNNYLFDRTIPFYQIAIHGVLNYSGEPINLSSDYEYDVLKSIETGSIPSFKWMYADNYALKDTKSNYYGLNYAPWVEQAATLYKQADEALGDCQNATIREHNQLGEGLYETVYSNDKRIYVNYNNRKATYKDISLEPESYKVIMGGAVYAK